MVAMRPTLEPHLFAIRFRRVFALHLTLLQELEAPSGPTERNTHLDSLFDMCEYALTRKLVLGDVPASASSHHLIAKLSDMAAGKGRRL
ncbi:MAG: hypothetical protein ACOVS5_03555 [Oligoflexus sp.]